MPPVNVLKILLPAVVLCLSAISAYSLMSTKPVIMPEANSDTKPTVSIIKAEPQSITLNIATQGIIKARDELDLSMEVSGKVIFLHPQFFTGGSFKKNDVLVRLDCRDYQNALMQAKAQLAEANRALITEQAHAKQARDEWRDLKEQPSDLAIHKPQLQEAEAKLNAAKSALTQAQTQITRCEIHAPFNGRFADKKISIGQVLEAYQAFAHIYSTDVFELRLPVTLDDLNYLDVKNTQVQLHANQQTWQTKIVRSEQQVNQQTGTMFLVAELHQDMLNGLFVEATLQSKPLNQVFVLPQAAVNALNQVLIVDDTQHLHTRTVSVLRHDGERVIINQGLNVGEHIVTSGIDLAIETMSVQETTP